MEFPDLDGAYSFGEDMNDALYMAKDLLEGSLIVAEKEGDPIPKASSPDDLIISEDALLIPIKVDLKHT
ncbi:type II toxin-antitoxin system HicB family antitoxin [Aerococcus urinae]